MSFSVENAPSQQGKTAIVTGSNTGLGYETALGLAKLGATVILACRNLEKAEAAKTKILSEVPSAAVSVMALDLNSLDSVRQFAADFRTQHQQLDLLINNAGIMFPPYTQTAEGFESQIGVNYLGHFLLTQLLIDLMPDTPDSRIVSLSSNAHKFGKLNFDDLQSEKNYSATAAYGQSKLACLMFADELQRRLAASGKQKISVAAHPGVAQTELARHMPGWLVWIMGFTVAPFITHPVDQAALPTLMAAIASDVKGGEYFGPQGTAEMTGKPGRAEKASHALDQDAATKLWQVSEQLTGEKFIV
ncbi:Protochlorophyllide reductase [[Leptolyngbya] sp. PCC 7376]|uniref:oxidoreductase n=1 Tax=[Leptolyngbya] sp. PCC 7376 TaxID=111781 RepID=UPI00029ED0B2|nr:oxidoreductase [[Leptolyngbya] sp. PCC 7376]AFY37737.1 Protochlorophyllide reductase [[Leptolyngbya] sp. PCC 7376]